MEVYEIIKGALEGKSIRRIILNKCLKEKFDSKGIIIDLASGDNLSYRFIKNLIKVDLYAKNVNIRADLNHTLPFKDDSIDAVIFFNAIYILKNPERILNEIYRILKPYGKLYLSSPFVFNEAPEPKDYFRFTSIYLKEKLNEIKFHVEEIIPIGERFSVITYIVSQRMPNFLKPFIYVPAFYIDGFLNKKIRTYRLPLNYFVIAKKVKE